MAVGVAGAQRGGEAGDARVKRVAPAVDERGAGEHEGDHAQGHEVVGHLVDDAVLAGSQPREFGQVLVGELVEHFTGDLVEDAWESAIDSQALGDGADQFADALELTRSRGVRVARDDLFQERGPRAGHSHDEHGTLLAPVRPGEAGHGLRAEDLDERVGELAVLVGGVLVRDERVCAAVGLEGPGEVLLGFQECAEGEAQRHRVDGVGRPAMDLCAD